MVQYIGNATRRNTMKLTLTQASKEVGVSKSTLSRAIDKGRLSAAKDDLGRFQIDPSELFRVFPPVSRNSTKLQQVEHDATSIETLKTAVLEKEIEHLKATLATLHERETDLKSERDSWRDQAQRLALPKPEVMDNKSLGIIAKLFGRK